MKVLVDISSAPDKCGWNTGLIRYAMNVLDGFAALGLKDIHILTTSLWKDYVKERFPEFNVQYFTRLPRIPVLDKPKGYVDSFRRRKAINNSGCDVVFMPFLGKRFDYRKVNIPLVLTVHDLQLYRITKPLNSFITKKLQFPLLIRRSTRLIAITDFVKKDTISFFKNVPEEKVVVIHNGVNLPEIEGPLPFAKEEKYILTVNSLTEYKNIITLVKAFNTLKDKIPHKLVIVGRTTEYWNNVIAPYVSSNNLDDRVIHLENLENDVLWGLYKHTSLFVSTSTMEGFGYTPVEAAIAGAKVISTNMTALPESTMGLVNYYEPATDPLALAEKIMETLDKEDYKERQMISSALKKEYDYVDRAHDVYSLLKSIL